MKISVAICTHNRCALLFQTLSSLSQACRPKQADWDVLVVDNASTDSSAEIIASFESVLPLKKIREERIGLSHARNAAIASLDTDYVIWTDDDVWIEHNWLIAYETAFLLHADAAVFGGPILPLFEGEPPQWLKDAFDYVSSAFAVRHAQRECPIDLTSRYLPFGANFAVRMPEQRRYAYDPAFGRNGNQRRIILGEEYQVIRQILDCAGTGWWIPAALIHHWIPRTRQTRSYLRQYFSGVGWTPGNMDNVPVPKLLNDCIQQELLYRYERVFGSAARWVPALANASMAFGRLAYLTNEFIDQG
jgi:glycosyltransferase involved in cell wall biosynthesis